MLCIHSCCNVGLSSRPSASPSETAQHQASKRVPVALSAPSLNAGNSSEGPSYGPMSQLPDMLGHTLE